MRPAGQVTAHLATAIRYQDGGAAVVAAFGDSVKLGQVCWAPPRGPLRPFAEIEPSSRPHC